MKVLSGSLVRVQAQLFVHVALETWRTLAIGPGSHLCKVRGPDSSLGRRLKEALEYSFNCLVEFMAETSAGFEGIVACRVQPAPNASTFVSHSLGH
jgi:hypothetical protein